MNKEPLHATTTSTEPNRQYRVTSFQKLDNTDGIMGLVLRVTVTQPIEWVRQHAEEIARMGIQHDPVARTLKSPIIALNVEEAHDLSQEGANHAN